MTYKEHTIPKKNGKVRKIVAPDRELLRYQRSKLSALERLYHRQALAVRLQSIAHGFIRGRNCVTAAEQHIGFKSTIIMDLSNFFDTVNRSMFSAPIYHEISKDDRLWHKDGYAAQGFATSPILANLAILPAMKALRDFLDKSGHRYALTIYADDLQVSTDIEDAVAVYDEIGKVVESIMEAHGFKINPNKTRIRFAKYGYRRILGINVGDEHVRASRKVMRKIRAARHQENNTSLGGLTNWSLCHKPRSLTI